MLFFPGSVSALPRSSFSISHRRLGAADHGASWLLRSAQSLLLGRARAPPQSAGGSRRPACPARPAPDRASGSSPDWAAGRARLGSRLDGTDASESEAAAHSGGPPVRGPSVASSQRSGTGHGAQGPVTALRDRPQRSGTGHGARGELQPRRRLLGGHVPGGHVSAHCRAVIGDLAAIGRGLSLYLL